MRARRRTLALVVAASLALAGGVTVLLPVGSAMAAACTAPVWAEGNTYQAGSQAQYSGKLYQAIVTHTAYPGTGWNPAATPSLWKEIGTCDSAPPSPGPSPSTPPPPPPPPPGGGIAVAPYVDMGAWPSPVLSDLAGGGNLRSFSLGFISGAACKASWFGAYDPRSGWKLDEINAIRARGGDVKVSFGGASGVELAEGCGSVAAATAEYQAVISAYALKYIDLDIEGAAVANPTTVDRRSQALANLQRTNPNLRISLTLPVLPSGLTPDGVNVVRSARDAGVRLDLVNAMAMDYYQNGDYGDFAVQAADSLFNQLKGLYPTLSTAQLWKMVGITPMLGQNDDGRIYNQADARQLVQYATSKHMGMLSFWETTRDRNACTGALYKCTNIPQQPYEFSRIFAGYTG
jgi:chitinase